MYRAENDQRLLQSVSPSHGRVLIYVWAIEQDELSKRKVLDKPNLGDGEKAGRDVFVPWVLSTPNLKPKGHKTACTDTEATSQPQVFNRYYHMFAKGELTGLVLEAAKDLGLNAGPPDGEHFGHAKGIEIVQDGWERSNYYIELQCWCNE
ncbi:hypothetical protein HWV62_39221 [Athelia sp. TMB]|nr:hypothetical protein HWV62_39221 [Athelia sp. TMB]